MQKALTSFMGWVDARLPVTRAWDTHMGAYYAPKNFNLWYFFGVFSLLVLVNQLLGAKAALGLGCPRARAKKHGHTDKSQRDKEVLYGGGS